MKRMLALLLICMLLLCAPSSAEPLIEAGASFLGPWTVETVIAEGVPIAPCLLGLRMSMTFFPDGTVLCVDDEDRELLPWHVENGAAIVDGRTLVIREDSKFLLTGDDTTLVFVRGEAAPEVDLSDEELLQALLTLMSQMEAAGSEPAN